jgi:hypothetical protein
LHAAAYAVTSAWPHLVNAQLARVNWSRQFSNEDLCVKLIADVSEN